MFRSFVDACCLLLVALLWYLSMLMLWANGRWLS